MSNPAAAADLEHAQTTESKDAEEFANEDASANEAIQGFGSLGSYKALNKIDKRKVEYSRIKDVLDQLIDTSRMISSIRKYLIDRGHVRSRKLKKRLKIKKKKVCQVSTQTLKSSLYKFEPTHFAYFLDKVRQTSTDGFLSVKAFAYILQDIMDHFKNSGDSCLSLPGSWSNLVDKDLVNLSCQLMVQHGCVNWKHFLMNCMDIPLPTQEDLINALEQFQSLDVKDKLYVDKNKYDLVSLWFEPLEPEIIASDPKPLQWRECVFQLFKDVDGQMLYIDFLLFCCRDTNPFIGITKALSIFVGYTLSTKGFPNQLLANEDFEFTDSDMEILFTEDEEQIYYHKGSVVVPFIPPEGIYNRAEHLLERMMNIKKRREVPGITEEGGESEGKVLSAPPESNSEPRTFEEMNGEDSDGTHGEIYQTVSEIIAKELSVKDNLTQPKESNPVKMGSSLSPISPPPKNEFNINEEEGEAGANDSNLIITPETMLNVLWFGHICAFPANSFVELTKSYKKLKSLVDEMYEDVLRYTGNAPTLAVIFQHKLMHQLLRRYKVFHELDFGQLIKQGVEMGSISDNAMILESSEEDEVEQCLDEPLEENEMLESPQSGTPSWYSNQSSTDEDAYYASYSSKPIVHNNYKHYQKTGIARQNPDDFIITKDGEVVPSSQFQPGIKAAEEAGSGDIFPTDLSQTESQTSIKGFGIDLEMLTDFNDLLSMDKKERDDEMAAGFSYSMDRDDKESSFIKQTLINLRNKKRID